MAKKKNVTKLGLISFIISLILMAIGLFLVVGLVEVTGEYTYTDHILDWLCKTVIHCSYPVLVSRIFMFLEFLSFMGVISGGLGVILSKYRDHYAWIGIGLNMLAAFLPLIFFGIIGAAC